MKLSEILKPDTIVLGFEAADKWRSMDRLVDRIIEKGRILKEHRQPVLDALIAREHVASTGMEDGVALPHASVQELDEPQAALGIAPQGIDFKCADGKPANLIMLLVIPKRSVQLHIRTLAGVARILNYEEMRHALVAAKTPEEAARIIQVEEDKEGS